MSDKSEKLVRLATGLGWQVSKTGRYNVFLVNHHHGVRIKIPKQTTRANQDHMRRVKAELLGFEQKVCRLKRKGNPFPYLSALRFTQIARG